MDNNKDIKEAGKAAADVGAVCAEAGCGIHDFLPFPCPSCEQTYCLTHRSRFVHHCLSSATTAATSTSSSSSGGSNNGNSVKEMFAAVEHRFDSDNIGTNKSHFNVASTQAPASSTANVSTAKQETISRLDHISSSTSSDKNRRIADKTKQILLARTAKGDENIPSDLRFYMRIRVQKPPSAATTAAVSDNVEEHEEETIFVSSYSTLGDVLRILANTYPRLLFGTAVRADTQSLGLFTPDSPDWKSWDRNANIAALLRPFEVVFVCPVTVSEAVAAQSELMNARAQQAQANSQKEELDRTVSVATEAMDVVGDGTTIPSDSDTNIQVETQPTPNSTPAPARRQLARGEVCLYTNGAGEQELATVVCAHLDDFPNVYYTIKIASQDNRERQTDASRLKPLPEDIQPASKATTSPVTTQAPPASPPQPATPPIDGFTINIAVGGDTFPLHHVTPATKILDIKLRIAASKQTKANIPPTQQKLIFKGKVLTDKQSLKDCNIGANAKILLMSAAAAASKPSGSGLCSGCMSV
jgi:predicted nucleic acid binding AN1-type Zn finger protein